MTILDIYHEANKLRGRDRVEARFQIAMQHKDAKTLQKFKCGRNLPCLCGSGAKYKSCCGWKVSKALRPSGEKKRRRK